MHNIMEFLRGLAYISMTIGGLSFLFAAVWLTIHVVRWDRWERDKFGCK